MLDLYKYSFGLINELVANNDTVNFPIRSSGPRKHNGRKGAYVTPNLLRGNYRAQYSLSITSTPNFRFTLDQGNIRSLENSNILSFLDNNQVDLGHSSSLTLEKIPRVWPSFGYFGGAREVFLAFDKGSSIGLTRRRRYRIPGGRDFYHFDDEENIRPVLLDGVVQGLLDAFESMDPNVEGDAVSVKRIGTGITANIPHFNGFDNNITSSIAFHDSRFETFIKCWVNVWSDDEKNLTRNFHFSQTAEYFFRGMSLSYLTGISSLTKLMFLPLYATVFEQLRNPSGHGVRSFSVRLQ